jgi:HEAT repeat protein
LAVSPYSVPVLKQALRHKSSAVRNQAVIALGRIAQKGLAAVQRDTSAFDDLAQAYGNERSRDVRASMANAVFFFSDAIDARQRDTAVDLLRGSLDQNSPDERLYAALSILEIDPRKGVAAVVEKALEGTAFREEARTIVLQALERTTGARFVGNEAERLEEWWNANKGKWQPAGED